MIDAERLVDRATEVPGVRRLAAWFQGHGLRWPLIRWLRKLSPPVVYPGRHLDVYWMSTGRCGTKFLSEIFRSAAGVVSYHDRGAAIEEVKEAVRLYKHEREKFWKATIESFPLTHAKIKENRKFQCRVFTEFEHTIFPFAYMIWKWYSERGDHPRVKMIHLVRAPVDCCRSILKVEREEEGGEGFARRPEEFLSGSSSAEKAARLWNGINEMCVDIIDKIGDKEVCRTVRIEDLDVREIEELFSFLELREWDRQVIQRIVANPAPDVRHSHIGRDDVSKVAASEHEIETIRRLTSDVGERLGYDC